MDAGLEAELSPPLQLALAWAPARARDATLALFALDTRLAGFLRRGGEPLAAQMRLAWWRETLGSPSSAWPRGDPLLDELSGWSDPEQLVALVDGWEGLLADELDEAAIIDGAGPMRLFFSVVLPLLRPVVVTVIVVQSVAIFNDFTNPLYFLPGRENVTMQLTLFNFQSQFNTQFNLLFMNILLITIPPLIVYIFFNRQIVAGLTAGAVKG